MPDKKNVISIAGNVRNPGLQAAGSQEKSSATYSLAQAGESNKRNSDCHQENM